MSSGRSGFAGASFPAKPGVPGDKIRGFSRRIWMLFLFRFFVGCIKYGGKSSWSESVGDCCRGLETRDKVCGNKRDLN